jgi:hypothetical protein
MVEYLPKIFETMGSIPSTARGDKEERKKKEVGGFCFIFYYT